MVGAAEDGADSVQRWVRRTRRDFLAAARAPHFSELLAEIRDEAERAATTATAPLPFHEYIRYDRSGDRLGYERPYFDRRRRLVGTATAALLDDGERDVAVLEDLLWTICDEYTWALPAHEGRNVDGRPVEQCVDLFAAETAHALSEIVCLMGDRLHPRVTRRVRAAVAHRVLEPLFDDPRPLPWESWRNNWSAVCAGSAGMAALLLVDDRDRLDRAVDRVLAAMRVFLSGFDPDGACREGIDYWVYGFGYFTYFAESLREILGIDLFARPVADQYGVDTDVVAAVAGFPGRISLGGGHYVNFADSGECPSLPTGLLGRLHHRLDETVLPAARVPSLHADSCYRWAHVSRTLCWTDPSMLGADPEPARAYLPDAQWLVDGGRCGSVAVAFAAKGGHNDEPHNHNDLGHFVLHVGGQSLLVDLGAPEYTRQYFGDGRYEVLQAASDGHSTPRFDGHTQSAGAGYRAEVLSYGQDRDGSTMVLDLTEAYGLPQLSSLHRSFEWRWRSDGGELLLTDQVRTTRAVMVEELFISALRPELDQGVAVWTGDRGRVVLRYRDGWRAEIQPLDITDHDGFVRTVFRLCLTSRQEPGSRVHRFRFLALPTI